MTESSLGRFWLAALAVGLAALLGSAGVFWATRPAPRLDRPDGPNPPERPPPYAGPAWFRDVTAASGVAFEYRNGEEADHYTILESLGGGVALIDYDGDGKLDVFLPGGGRFVGPDKKSIVGMPCKLYRNLGAMKFDDVTARAGLDLSWPYTHGAAVADYDRDGWPDLLVTGYGRLVLLHNEPDGKGGRRFADVTRAMGLRDDSWSASAGFADLDGDGWPDLYVTRYVDWSWDNHPTCPAVSHDAERDVCAPQKFKPLRHSVYVNDKGKGFRDESAGQGFAAAGCGLGVLLADLDGDGKPDVYVANDASDNFLYFNRSEGGKLRLQERGRAAGAAADENGAYNGSMGVDAADYDGSGRPSVWVTNFQGELHALYANRGRETFQHASRAAGVGAIGQHYVGFGTGFLDLDNDGWEDLVVANGHVWRHPSLGRTLKQKPVLLRNVASRGRRTFEEVGERGGTYFATPAVGRGVAVGDLDDDGWPDLVVSHSNSPAAVLRNEASAVAKHRWLGVVLKGKGARDVAGATVSMEAGGRRLWRYAKGGGSYLSAGDSRLLFGVGEGEAGEVTVRWPWGGEQKWRGLSAGAYWVLSEGEERARRAGE